MNIYGCKNSVINLGETCDNTDPGCGSDCQPTTGYECFSNNTCSLICGNGVINTGEDCDYVGNGCTLCKSAAGYECLANNTCRQIICGNGIINKG